MRYGDVDSHQNTEIQTHNKLNCNFEKEGGSLLELISGTNNAGFTFCLVEQGEFEGARSVSMWKLQ